MSTSLYWRPKYSPEEYNIGYLKHILEKQYFNGTTPYATLTNDDLLFLQGVKLGSLDDNIISACDKVIAAIEKHEKIEIYFE